MSFWRCPAPQKGGFCAPDVQLKREIRYNRAAAAGEVPGQAEKDKGVTLTISVRQATRHDWPALQRLFLLSRCHTFTWLNVTDFRLTDLEKQTEGETIWLAHDPQGELAGFIAVWMPDHFIHHLHVAPARQGYGVGKMLLQALPGWQEHGYRLKCLTLNRNALAFYAASGFVTMGEGISDEGAYRLLERKGAWPEQPAKKMRLQAHR